MQKFEGAQKRELLMQVRIGEGFCQVDKRGEDFQMQGIEFTFFLGPL